MIAAFQFIASGGFALSDSTPSHCGIIIRDSDGIKLIHASTEAKKATPNADGKTPICLLYLDGSISDGYAWVTTDDYKAGIPKKELIDVNGNAIFTFNNYWDKVIFKILPHQSLLHSMFFTIRIKRRRLPALSA